MNILIVCESQAIKDGVIDHLKSNVYSIHNNYKVVCCEPNVVDSAVVTALEVNADLKRYDLIASVSKATELDLMPTRTVIMPVRVTDGKCDALDVDGIEDCCMVSGPFEAEDLVKVTAKYGKDVCFDSIAYGVSYVAEDYGIDNVVISIANEQKCGSVITILER